MPSKRNALLMSRLFEGFICTASPDDDKSSSDTCSHEDRGRYADGSKDDCILEQGVIHNKMIIDIIGFLRGDEALLLEFEHYGGTIAESYNIADEPHISGMVGESEEAHYRREEARDGLQEGESLNHTLDHHQDINDQEDERRHLELRDDPGEYHLRERGILFDAEIDEGVGRIGEDYIE